MIPTLTDIKYGVSLLSNMYDAVRIVDPVSNRVVWKAAMSGQTSLLDNSSCYDFWTKDRFCDNCISVRALKEKKTFTKFEAVHEELYMITASPLLCEKEEERNYVLEFVHNITHESTWNSIVSNEEENFAEAVLRLNDAVVRDELTGVFNRRFINERLPVEIVKHHIAQTPAYLLMIDIDFFKIINDTYGHQGGDVTLRQFAKLLQKQLPHSTCWAARYGGDEFLIYLEQMTFEQVYGFAENLCTITENYSIIHAGNKIKTTYSMGVCRLQPGMDMDAWIKKADENLYKAKSARDQNLHCTMYGI